MILCCFLTFTKKVIFHNAFSHSEFSHRAFIRLLSHPRVEPSVVIFMSPCENERRNFPSKHLWEFVVSTFFWSSVVPSSVQKTININYACMCLAECERMWKNQTFLLRSRNFPFRFSFSLSLLFSPFPVSIQSFHIIPPK